MQKAASPECWAQVVLINFLPGRDVGIYPSACVISFWQPESVAHLDHTTLGFLDIPCEEKPE